jgi:hypothetical protein
VFGQSFFREKRKTQKGDRLISHPARAAGVGAVAIGAVGSASQAEQRRLNTVK